MEKGPDRFDSKFQEIVILLSNLNVSKRPYPSHALSRSVCLGQWCRGAGAVRQVFPCPRPPVAPANSCVAPQSSTDIRAEQLSRHSSHSSSMAASSELLARLLPSAPFPFSTSPHHSSHQLFDQIQELTPDRKTGFRFQKLATQFETAEDNDSGIGGSQTLYCGGGGHSH